MRDRRPTWAIPFFANTLLIQAITFVLRPTATYRALELGVPAHWLGALGATFAIVPLLLAVPSGRLVDQLGERIVMLAGSVVTTAAALTFTFFGSAVWGLLVASVLLGTGHLGSVVGQQALVANRTPTDRYDRAFGRYTFAASAGQAVGPGLIVLFGGAAAIPRTGHIFAWSAGVCLLLIISAAWLPASRTAAGSGTSPGSVVDLLRRPGLVRALSISCVVLAAVDISLVYLPAWGAERGIASGTVGLLLAARAVSSMTSRLFLGHLVARLGRAMLLTGSVLLSAATMAVLPLIDPTAVLVVVVVLMGLGLGCGQPLTMSWLAEASPAGLRGRAMSLRLTGNRLGQVVIPSAAGALAVGSGAGAVLWATAAALALAGVASRRIEGPRPTTSPPDPLTTATTDR